MSLFTAREWWRTQCGSGEEFDGNALCVACVDNDPDDTAKIITGSLQGMLRIHQPRQRDYRAEDLLYEQELEQAILQLAVGRFSTAGGLQLAVLHPRKLVVMHVTNVGAQYLQVTRLYEHYLEHTAANMCYGTFGGVKGCDHICVQSYDGQLSFFECELFAFARYLPSFLVPGPLAYIEAADLVVTCSAALELEGYRYKSLAAASGDKHPQQAAGPGPGGLGRVAEEQQGPGGSGEGGPQQQVAGLSAGKRVSAEWRVVLGEAAIDIRAAQLSPGLQAYQADIVVLCEHHVYVVSSTTGQVVFQKRLEYHPACAALATVAPAAAKLPGGAHNLLVATHNKSLAVYRFNVLVWAARLEHQPVALAVATLGDARQAGLLVSLDDAGGLLVAYLGTDPMANPVGWVEGSQLDYEAMSREQRTLATIIREHAGGRRVTPPDNLTLRAQVPSVWDHVRGMGPTDPGRPQGASGLMRSLHQELDSSSGRMRGMPAAGPRITARLQLTYQGASHHADKVHVSIKAPACLALDQDSWVVPCVGSGEGADEAAFLPFTLSPLPTSTPPASRTLHVSAWFSTPSGEPRAQHLAVPLPLCLFATMVPAVKNAEFKVTVSTDQPAPQLSALFEDLAAAAPAATLQSYTATGANVMSVSVAGGGVVTVLVSKTASRYRVQADCLEDMWLVVSELVERLDAYYAAEGGGTQLEWGCDEQLPLQDVLQMVDVHWAARQRLAQLTRALDQRAAALRAIQKRLLLRFKDKSPAPLCQLDVLLEQTYSALQEAGNQIEQQQVLVQAAGAKLSGALQLLVLLARVKFGLSPAEAAMLSAALCVDVAEVEAQQAGPGLDGMGATSSGVGWEELAEASLTQLLRTCLARSGKESAASVPPLAPCTDTSRLHRLLTLVLERLSKGQRMALEPEEGQGAAQSTTPATMARQISKQISARASNT